ncbi:MAG: pyrroloquinoline quinone biosynthesis protein PqqB [Chloroflexi bacterium]|nr:pyrroloquinoline quinone biosynthesis protein PqqB [Chloroflexota bacterium]MBU1750853.1 pyrroloquinoline quinone biosynthesis protein PqqB [Chloroflexota bacterium]MBU1880219.1 pyrroloquinoline quinone biosynthesis protein PqqB [Chloroflexota bacterium]
MSVEAVLLGTAQDGGMPQAGCMCANCADPARRAYAACLGLVDRATGQSWLIDATPDFREQWRILHDLAPDCPLAGIALTHAHMGHYAGLIHLGREAWNTRGLPVYASARMADFLRGNAPWSQLVNLGNIRLHEVSPGQPVALGPRLSLTPHVVPHRDEFSDTLVFVVSGPARRLFYCPDIDRWDDWPGGLREFLGALDVALLDGTFWSADELPGRDVCQVPHPLGTDTARRLAGLSCDVRLIHLNHTNPLHRPGPARDWLAAQGLGVGALGDRWSLEYRM